VLVLYAADGAAIHGEERERLMSFLGRGGGLVVLHDGVCGDDPHWFKTVAGGAWEHGHSQYLEGEIGLCFADHEHPITRGAANFDFEDEIYWDLHLDPGAHVLANAFHTPFDVTPQMCLTRRTATAPLIRLSGRASPIPPGALPRADAGRASATPTSSLARRAGRTASAGWTAGSREAARSLTAPPASPAGGRGAPDRSPSLDGTAGGRVARPGLSGEERFSGVPAHGPSIVCSPTATGTGAWTRSRSSPRGSTS
jgi:hypothetical protein